MKAFQKLQAALAAQASVTYEKQGTPLSKKVLEAFLRVPRHEFVERIRNFGDDHWQDFNPESENQLLPVIYQDGPLIIWGSEKEFAAKQGVARISTISQPSFVLRMLDLLDIHPGHKVFELGTASGWNAALIAEFVGADGQVMTAEIIPELAKKAAARLAQRDLRNVSVISGDGAFGDSKVEFDRVMFTAGAFDFPQVFFEQTRPGSLVLFILKNKGGMDTLYLLKRHEGFFESIYAEPCGFVSVTGSIHLKEMEEKNLEEFLVQKGISSSPVTADSFWWGSSNKGYFIGQTTVIRGFLSLFANFEAFLLPDNMKAFGWYDAASNSLAVAKAGEILAFGSTSARERLKEKLKDWIDLGMPTLGVMKLKIYRTDFDGKPRENQWISRRLQATFVWEISKDANS